MATVLCAWELGEGIGYVRALAAVARSLRAEGHSPVLALRDLVEPRGVFGNTLPALQAPCWHARRWRGARPFAAASFADVLALAGYASAETLGGLVQGWDDLLDLVRPRLVVAAYAPTCALAARGRVPVVSLGVNWFSLPPRSCPQFPPLAPGGTALLAQGRLAEVLQQVQRGRGRELTEPPPAALQGDRSFLAVLPELDHYSPFRREPYFAPPDPLPAPGEPPAGRTYFAYLSGDYPCGQLLGALHRRGWAGAAYVRGSSEGLRAQLRSHGVRAADGPVPPGEMLGHGLLVHHGTVGTAQAALAAGRPQLLFPLHMEQQLNARALHRLGVARHFEGKFALADVAGAAEELLLSPQARGRVAEVSREVGLRRLPASLPAVLECCRQYLS